MSEIHAIARARVGWASPTIRCFGGRVAVGDAHPTFSVSLLCIGPRTIAIQPSSKRLIFAAQIKSLWDKPPMAWVL